MVRGQKADKERLNRENGERRYRRSEDPKEYCCLRSIQMNELIYDQALVVDDCLVTHEQCCYYQNDAGEKYQHRFRPVWIAQYLYGILLAILLL